MKLLIMFVFILSFVVIACDNGTEPPITGHSVAIINIEKITDSGYHPRWSANGAKIVYTIWNNTTGKAELRIWNKALNSSSLLVQNMKGDLTPNWNYEGTKIVFDAYDANNVSQLWEADVVTGSVTQITFFSTPAFQPAYSKDGTKIVFQYQNSIQILNRSNGSITKIPSTENCSAPNWNSDNTRITFSYAPNQNNISDIYIINIDGTEKKQLTTYSGRDDRPRVSDDGNIIVYECFKNSNVLIGFYFLDSAENFIYQEITEGNNPDYSQSTGKIVFVKSTGIYIADVSIKYDLRQ